MLIQKMIENSLKLKKSPIYSPSHKCVIYKHYSLRLFWMENLSKLQLKIYTFFLKVIY